jgi:hypothetical protein
MSISNQSLVDLQSLVEDRSTICRRVKENNQHLFARDGNEKGATTLILHYLGTKLTRMPHVARAHAIYKPWESVGLLVHLSLLTFLVE